MLRLCQSRLFIRSLSFGVLLLGVLTVRTDAQETRPTGATKPSQQTSYTVERNIPYKTGVSGYEKERCVLDVYRPKKSSGKEVLVWFHGGGLTGGSKDVDLAKIVGDRFASVGVYVVMVNYRLSPKATYPAYIQDAAASVAWTKENIGKQGGSDQKIFVGGHSAGAYLTMMLALDEKYLRENGVKLKQIAGWIPVSAQVDSHWTVRAERGIDRNTQVIDESAPLFHIRKDTPKMLVIVADNDLKGRADLNKTFVSKMKGKGHSDVPYHMIPDRDHGSLISELKSTHDPTSRLILDFIRIRK